jgi:general secretion pathway protein K
VDSKFFEIRSRLRLDKLVVEEHTIVRRDANDVSILQRQRGGSSDAKTPLQGGALR